MKSFRWVLLPFALVYGAVTRFRNRLFNLGWKRSYKIPGKSITIGNLSVGGTGKSPLVAYLIEYFLSENIPVATLSRGYGRKTKGLINANPQTTAKEIGDEPLQYQNRFGDAIQVIVSEDRKTGVDHIRKELSENTIILLDDAFQHRKVQAGINILVTEFHRPYSKDFLLPVGRLRESTQGANRADIILVSKCPESITVNQKEELKSQLAKSGQPVFLSSFRYGDWKSISGALPEKVENVLLVTGIGNPEPLLDHLKTKYSLTHIKFPDHYDYSAGDIDSIHQKFNTFASRDKIILTTEKDFMRLQDFKGIQDGSKPWFYQPIDIVINEEKQLKTLLDEYVRKN